MQPDRTDGAYEEDDRWRDERFDTIFDGALQEGEDGSVTEDLLALSSPTEVGEMSTKEARQRLSGMLAHVRLSVLPNGSFPDTDAASTNEDGSAYWSGRRFIKEELFQEAIRNQFSHRSGIVKLRRMMRMDPRPWNIYYRLREAQFPLQDDECAALLLWTGDLAILEGTTSSGSAIPAHAEAETNDSGVGGREPLPPLSYHSNPAKIPVWRLGQELLATREHVNCLGLHRGRKIHAVQMGNEMYFSMSGAQFANSAVEKNGGEAITSDDQGMAAAPSVKAPKPGVDVDNAGIGTVCAYLRLCEIAGDLTSAFNVVSHFLEVDRAAQARSPEATPGTLIDGIERPPAVSYNPNTILYLLWLARVAAKSPNHERVEEIVQLIQSVYDDRRLWEYTVEGREAISRMKFEGASRRRDEADQAPGEESPLVATTNTDDSSIIEDVQTEVKTLDLKPATYLGASPLLLEQENELFAILYFQLFRKVEGVIKTDPEADEQLLTWVLYQYLRCCVGLSDARSSAVSLLLMGQNVGSPQENNVRAWMERHSNALALSPTMISNEFFAARRPPVPNSMFPQLSRSEPLFVCPKSGVAVYEPNFKRPFLVDSLLKPAIIAQLAERAFPLEEAPVLTPQEELNALRRARIQSLLKLSRTIQQSLAKCQEWWLKNSGDAIEQAVSRQKKASASRGPISNVGKKIAQEQLSGLDLKLMLPADTITDELRIFADALSNKALETLHPAKWGPSCSLAHCWMLRDQHDDLHRTLMYPTDDKESAKRGCQLLESAVLEIPPRPASGIKDLSLGLFAERYAAASGIPAEVYHYLLVGLFWQGVEAVRDLQPKVFDGDCTEEAIKLPPVVAMGMNMYRSVATKAGLRLCDVTRGFILGSLCNMISTLRDKGISGPRIATYYIAGTDSNRDPSHELLAFAGQIVADQSREMILRRRLDVDNECSSAVVSHWAGDYPSLLLYRNAFASMDRFYSFALEGCSGNETRSGVEALLDVVVVSEIHGKVVDKVARIVSKGAEGEVEVFLKTLRDDLVIADTELAMSVAATLRRALSAAIHSAPHHSDPVPDLLDTVPQCLPKLDVALMGAIPCFENYSLGEGSGAYIATTTAMLATKLADLMLGNNRQPSSRRAVYILDSSFLENPQSVPALLSLIRKHTEGSPSDDKEPFILVPYLSLEQVAETVLTRSPDARNHLDAASLFADGTDLIDSTREISGSFFSSRVVIDRENELQYKNDNPEELAAVSAALANQHLNACSSTDIRESLMALRSLNKLLSRPDQTSMAALHFTECCLALEATSAVTEGDAAEGGILRHLEEYEAAQQAAHGWCSPDVNLLRIAQMVRLLGIQPHTTTSSYDVYLCTDDPLLVMEAGRDKTMRALSHGVQFVSTHPAVTAALATSTVAEKRLTPEPKAPIKTVNSVREEDAMGVLNFFDREFTPVLKDVPVVPLSADDELLLGRISRAANLPQEPLPPSSPSPPAAEEVQLDTWMALLEDDEEDPRPVTSPTKPRPPASTKHSPIYPQCRAQLDLLLKEAELKKSGVRGQDRNAEAGAAPYLHGRRILGLETLAEIAPVAEAIRRGGSLVRDAESREERRAREAILRASGIDASEDPHGRAIHARSLLGKQDEDEGGGGRSMYDHFHSTRPIPEGEYSTQEEELGPNNRVSGVSRSGGNPYAVEGSADARMPVEGGRPGEGPGETASSQELSSTRPKSASHEIGPNGLPVFDSWSLAPLRQDHLANVMPTRNRLHREAKHVSNILNTKVGRKFVVKRFEANVNDPRNKHLVDAFRHAIEKEESLSGNKKR